MENLNPETIGTATFLLTAMVIGGTELVKRVSKRDWEAVAIIVVASLIGGLGGLFVVPAVGIAPGLVLGLSASGVVTGLQKVSGR